MRRARCALLALLTASATACRSTPAAVERDVASAAKGEAVVVFFTDFQCPFCRRTHLALDRARELDRGPVRVVLRHVPLRSHPDADGAARASICAEALAPRAAYERITTALFTTPDLGPESCEAIVANEGVALDAYRRCLVAGETSARLERDLAAFLAADGDGVPLLFVGRERLDGAQDTATLRDALATARR